MAYVFDSIDSALGDQPATSDQSNIFSSTTPTTTTGSQPQAGAGDVKTSTDADVGTASTSGSSPSASAPKVDASQNANAAVAQNSQAFSALPDTYQKGVDKINTDLQNEANSYVSTQSAKGSAGNVDNDTLSKAVGGDTASQNSVINRLNATAPTVDPYASAVNTTIPDLDSLNSSAGLAGVMSRNASPDYTSGLANLDAMLLGQNKDFISARQNLNQTQAAIKQKQLDDQTALTTQAQTAAKSNFDAGTGQIKGYLTDQESQLDAAAAAKMKAYNDQQATYAKSGDPAYVAAQKAAAMKALSTQSAATPYASYLNKVSVDPNKYFAGSGAVSDPNAFYDQDSSAKFNLLESLLGGTGTRTPTAVLPTAQESFKTNDYQNAVKTAATAAYQKDQASRAAAAQLAASPADLGGDDPDLNYQALQAKPQQEPAFQRAVGNTVKTLKRAWGG